MKPIAILTLNKVDYPILKVKEGYVAVDENPKKLNGSWYLSLEGQVALCDRDKTVVGINQIIASTFPLEGVKRFEMVDEAEQYALSIIPHTDEGNVEDDIDSAKRRLIVHGYKTAQSKGLFNEEQMHLLAAYVTDFIAGRKGDFMITTPKDVADKFIQTLLPRYEVEMELTDADEVYHEVGENLYNNHFHHYDTGRKTIKKEFEHLYKIPITYEKEGITYLKFKTVK